MQIPVSYEKNIKVSIFPIILLDHSLFFEDPSEPDALLIDFRLCWFVFSSFNIISKLIFLLYLRNYSKTLSKRDIYSYSDLPEVGFVQVIVLKADTKEYFTRGDSSTLKFSRNLDDSYISPSPIQGVDPAILAFMLWSILIIASLETI